MKLRTLLPVLLSAWLAPALVQANTTPNDGDWTLQYVAMTNTPEAELMIRVGDIDNLGFGWPINFDPFSGNNSPWHSYPWTPNEIDADGTDRILVVTSYDGTPPCGRDGYTAGTSRPGNSVRPIVLDFPTPNGTLSNATFQIFVDDFQAPVWCGDYTVTLNGVDYSEMEVVIDSLRQTGPIGKLITVAVPQRLLPEVATGHVELEFDDLTTGAGDGYAIDFVKLLLNQAEVIRAGAVSGRITDAFNGAPIEGATVSTFSLSTTTATDGTYLLTNAPAGLALLSAIAPGYVTGSLTTDIVAGQTSANRNLSLSRAPLEVVINPAGEGMVEVGFYGHVDLLYALQRSEYLTNWLDVESITGSGGWIYRTNNTLTNQLFWQVRQP